MRKDNNNLNITSKALLLICSICLFAAIFVPLWRIELSAPQYPEGLVLQIFADKLGGQVDIINGLNHYIGMKTLHKEDFIEFTILPYLIGAFALMALSVALIGKKRGLYLFMGSFVLFGIVAMIDFYRWNYNYGHHLDPNAAIIVPGMAYQPPLIGYKQLLNFGAYSIPDTGGWLFVVSGLLMVWAVLAETKALNQFRKKQLATVAILTITLLSCSNSGVPTIKLNTDNCDFCKMTIADGRFGAALTTQKGRIYKFDDLGCMLQYKRANGKLEFKDFFVADFTQSNMLIPAEKAFFIKGESIASPMRGNIAAFKDAPAASPYQQKMDATPVEWRKLITEE